MEPTTDESTETAEPQARRPKRMRGMIAAAVGFILLVIATIAGRNGDSKAPFSARQVAPTVQLQVVSAASSQRHLDALAGPGRLTAASTSGPDVIVGQLSFTTPGGVIHGQGQYVLLFVDNASHRPLASVWGVGPVGSIVRQGWDSHYEVLAKSHSLFASGASGSAVSFTTSVDSPVTFEALPPAGTSITDARSQLTVALAFFSTGGKLYWVDKVPL